jgi:hypothetical protein
MDIISVEKPDSDCESVVTSLALDEVAQAAEQNAAVRAATVMVR